MPDGVSPRVARVFVGAGAVLFLGAGVLMLLAADQPWDELWRDGWAGQPSWAGQEHFYDYLGPSDPWLPVPAAASLGGAAQLLVAVAMALVFLAVRSPWWSRLVQLAIVGSVLALGLGTIAAGRSEVPVQPSALWWWATVPWIAVVPLIAVVLEWVRDPGSWRLLPDWTWLTWMFAMILVTPVPRLFLMPGIVGEEPPGPWDVAVSVVPLIAAGSVLLVGLARTRRRSSERSAPRVPARAGDRSGA